MSENGSSSSLSHIPQSDLASESQNSPHIASHFIPQLHDLAAGAQNLVDPNSSTFGDPVIHSPDLHFTESNSEEATTREEERSAGSSQEVEPYREAANENGAVEQFHRLDQGSAGRKSFSLKERDPEDNGQHSAAGTGISGREDSDRSRHNDGSQDHMINSMSASESVLHNSTAWDEEEDSRQQILVFAAKRYASAVESNPEDYDALYNWALVLQESADHVGSETKTAAKDQLLEEACKKYEQATNLCPSLHEAFYNWAIAVSDRAKNRGRTKEAEDLWKQACKRYEQAVQLKWNSPQAFNNWGLALQELSGIVPIKDRQLMVKTAVKKFRIAIQLQFDFHRAIYNLGTVLYGLAEDTQRSGKIVATKDSGLLESAIYIAAAHALKPDYSVYRSALRLVHSMIPLPYLKMGYLTVPPGGKNLAPHCNWKRTWFVLDHEALYENETEEHLSLGQSPLRVSNGMAPASSSAVEDVQWTFRIEISEIAHVFPCADLSLPSGRGFCVNTKSGEQCLIADTWEAIDSWVDALRLAYTIYVRGHSDILAGVLAC